MMVTLIHTYLFSNLLYHSTSNHCDANPFGKVIAKTYVKHDKEHQF